MYIYIYYEITICVTRVQSELLLPLIDGGEGESCLHEQAL